MRRSEAERPRGFRGRGLGTLTAGLTPWEFCTYEAYWGLREKPVENTPDRRCLFQSDETADVNIRLLYTLKSNGGAALLTGEFGCGMAIDEGQLVEDPEVLEEIRLLLNFQLNDAFLITLLMMGTEALADKIRNSPLDQRIAARGILKPMGREDVHEYVAHRLDVAGRKEPVFSSDALDLVHDFSDGVPRAWMQAGCAA